jgi:hypothetical protein
MSILVDITWVWSIQEWMQNCHSIDCVKHYVVDIVANSYS